MLKPANNKVDVNALKALLEETGMSNREISEKLGYGGGQMANVINRGVISKPVIVALDTIFGIKYEDYCPSAPSPAVAEPQHDDHAELIEFIRQTVKRSVLEAFEQVGFYPVNRK